MSITPIINKVTPAVQGLEKKGQVIVQSLTSAPGEKMGAWTMRGYGIPQESFMEIPQLSRMSEAAKPLGKINYLG